MINERSSKPFIKQKNAFQHDATTMVPLGFLLLLKPELGEYCRRDFF
jgi:hypothetical protein